MSKLDDALLVPVPAGELIDMARRHEKAGHHAEAEALLRRVLAVVPRHPEALHILGLLAFRGRRLEEAVTYLNEAIAYGLDTPLYWRNLAEIYRVMDRLEDADAASARAVALDPANPVALSNRGVVLADLLRLDEAIAHFEAAIRLNPTQAGAHLGLAEALLTRGEFGRGWNEYEWRFRIPGAALPIPKTDRPQWDGAPLRGPLLLVADQGFGDAIQFCRYIPWAMRRCGTTVLACSPQLQPVLRAIHPDLRVVTEWRQAGAFAAWCPLTGLPRLAGTTQDTVPPPLPTLRADAAKAAFWGQRLDALVPRGLRRVGLVWAGRPEHANDHRRSMTLADLAPVAAQPGIALVVLQKGPPQRQAGAYYGHAPLLHLSTDVQDFADTLAIIDRLDLVLTVDTSIAHLAGTIGKPVWIMLPHRAEWRWLTDRADSPWYPSALLFRQHARGCWIEVVQDVIRELGTQSPASGSADITF